MSKMRRSQDVGWLYGEAVGGRKDRVKCNYCHQVFHGGITQFKKHFIGKKGGTGACASATEDVREIIRQKLNEAEQRRINRCSTKELDACNKRTDKIMTRQAMMELRSSGNVHTGSVFDSSPCIPSKELGIRKRKHINSKQQKKLKTSGNVDTESVFDSPLCAPFPSKELDIRKRKHLDSKQQKKPRTSGNVHTESVFDSSHCIPTKELGIRKKKHISSKKEKKRRTSEKDAIQSFYVSSLPRYTRAKKLRGIKERCKNSKEQKKLDTNVFESYLEYLWSEISDVKRKSFTYLDCLWFSSYKKGPSQTKVLTWIKKKQIFSRKYVFVPIICWRHWSLLIFCHFGESFLSNAKRPCMLLLDSLGKTDPMRLEPDIRRFVLDIYKSEGCEEEESISKIPLLVPKVPQQRDGEECGIFVLYFIHLFLQSAPEAFKQEGYPYFLTENWFSWEDMEIFHKEVLNFATVQKSSWRLVWYQGDLCP